MYATTVSVTQGFSIDVVQVALVCRVVWFDRFRLLFCVDIVVHREVLRVCHGD